MSKNYLARIIVAAIFIPTILWVSYQGGWWLFGMLFLFSIIAINEFLHNEAMRPNQILFWISLLTVIILFINGTAEFIMRYMTFEQSKVLASTSIIPTTAVFFLISGMLLSIGKKPAADLFARYGRLLWGIVYVGLLYPIVFLVGLGIDKYVGGDLLLFLFGIIWIGDTAAMEIGKRYGKNKLAPSISPNKSVEGFVAGFFGAALVAVLMHYWKFPSVSLVHLLVIAIGCSLFGQLGDLVESMWKRSINIKDSSSIIPGHGGILDRFDSLLFAAPFMYAYFKLVL